MRRILVMGTVACALCMSTSHAHAQSAADSAAIRAAALDYIDGWYTGDAARMERALHPSLVKRIVSSDAVTAQSRLGEMPAAALIQATGRGGGSRTPVAARREDVTILDVFRNAASVKVDASGWVDYLHLTKWNGKWVILNVLWEMK